MSRIEEAFARLGGKEGACMPFLVAGDPGLRASEEYALALVEGGADLMEIGFPFSDPVADGPTIQAASQRALRKKSTVDQVFGVVARVRKKTAVPIVLLAYYNLIVRRGEREFVEEALSAGADGILAPDLPIEEAGSLIAPAREQRLSTIFLASPATPEERLRRIIDRSSGFLYLVARYGVTGEQEKLSDRAAAMILRVGQVARAKVPLAVGFGISTPEQVAAVIRAGADGAIVGSAIVRRIAEKQTPSQISVFVRTLKQATLVPGHNT